MTAFLSSGGGTGNWQDPNSWTALSSYPKAGDTATIQHTIYMDANNEVGTGTGTAITINAAGGRLCWPVSPGGSWTLTIDGNVDISNGGTFEVGNETDRIPSGVTATVIMNMASSQIDIAATGGTFKAYGAIAYHMDAAAYQRTTNVNSFISGSRTVTMADPANYHTGDTVWFGAYAGKGTGVYSGSYQCEKVSITNVSNTQFTANFSYAHDAGDFIVSQARNVIIQGVDTTHGYSINGTFGATMNVYMQADWVYFDRAGYSTTFGTAGFAINDTNTPEPNQIPAGQFRCTNCLFNSLTSGVNGHPIWIQMDTVLADADVAFKNLHFYLNIQSAYQDVIYMASSGANKGIGVWRFDNFTNMGISSSYYGFNTGNDGQNSWLLNIDGYWHSGKNGSGNIFYANHRSIGSFTNSKVYGFNTLIYGGSGSGPGMVEHADMILTNVVFYHCVYSAGAILWSVNNAEGARNLILKNCTFYDCAYPAIVFTTPIGDVTLDTCSFDKCNSAPSVSAGTIYFGYSANYITPGVIRMRNCTFGTETTNSYRNIYLGRGGGTLPPYSGAGTLFAHRIILEQCTFKQPTTFGWASAASSSWTNTMGWAVQDDASALNDWRVRARWGADFTFEFIDCIIKDSGGTDQWPVTYPNTYRLAVVPGGSEVRQEVAMGYIIDNSYPLKILPHSATARCHVTRRVPIKIPANNGQTVTVKLSLQKNQSQATGRRPMIHLWGLGIDTSSEMTDVTGSWEQLTVSGVAGATGVVHFWVSVINEPDNAISYHPDAFNSPKALGWLVVQTDGLIVTVV